MSGPQGTGLNGSRMSTLSGRVRRFRFFDFDSDSDPDFDDCHDPVACGSPPDSRNAPKRCQTTSFPPRFSRRGTEAARFRDVTTEERPRDNFKRGVDFPPPPPP
jgi:hypothetical protein